MQGMQGQIIDGYYFPPTRDGEVDAEDSWKKTQGLRSSKSNGIKYVILSKEQKQDLVSEMKGLDQQIQSKMGYAKSAEDKLEVAELKEKRLKLQNAELGSCYQSVKEEWEKCKGIIEQKDEVIQQKDEEIQRKEERIKRIDTQAIGVIDKKRKLEDLQGGLEENIETKRRKVLELESENLKLSKAFEENQTLYRQALETIEKLSSREVVLIEQPSVESLSQPEEKLQIEQEGTLSDQKDKISKLMAETKQYLSEIQSEKNKFLKLESLYKKQQKRIKGLEDTREEFEKEQELHNANIEEFKEKLTQQKRETQRKVQDEKEKLKESQKEIKTLQQKVKKQAKTIESLTSKLTNKK